MLKTHQIFLCPYTMTFTGSVISLKILVYVNKNWCFDDQKNSHETNAVDMKGMYLYIIIDHTTIWITSDTKNIKNTVALR